MNTTTKAQIALALVGILAAGSAAPSAAQLADPSATSLGMGGNTTAIVRGFGAIAVNPAGLGMHGPDFSLAVAPVQVRLGMDPITLSDLADFGGQLVDNATKEAWLADVVREGGQTGSALIGLSELALTVGGLGLQVSTIGGLTQLNLEPDLVELALYGNAGRSGQPEDFSLGGSTGDAFAVSTAGLSYGFRVGSGRNGDIALGATVKYSVGHAVAVGRERSGSLSATPIVVQTDFPVVHTDEDEAGFAGSGLGLDVGFQYHDGDLFLGAAVQNVFNTFEWDRDKLVYRPITAEVRRGSSEAGTDPQPLAQAPADLRALIDDMTFDPSVALGIAYDYTPDFTLSADLKNRFGDGIALDPKFHLGGGAEIRVGVIQLQAGAAVITDGFQYGGGGSLVLGPVNLSFAGAVQQGDLDDAVIVHAALSFGSN